MSGILVFTNYDVLIHKLKDGRESEGFYCYWEISRVPKQKVDRIYNAINGIIKGYFKIFGIKENNETRYFEICFHSESWTELKNWVKLKPSQGWRYYECQ